MNGTAIGAAAVLALASAALPALLTWANLPAFRRAARRRPRDGRVSVLVPARNESQAIGRLLDDVLASRDVDLELVILDDDSTDGTADLVERRAVLDPRVRLVRGGPLPEGWCGKQHACWQLSRAAFRLDRIGLVGGLSRIFSAGTVRAAIGNAAGLAVLAVAAGFAAGPLVTILRDAGATADPVRLFAAAHRLLLPLVAAAAAVAAVAWLLTRARFERRIRMTPEEYADEARGMQADPKVRLMRQTRQTRQTRPDRGEPATEGVTARPAA